MSPRIVSVIGNPRPESRTHGSLAGISAVPILLGGAPDHHLAVDVHFTPLLLELGARVPARGLFVLEADLPAFGTVANGWAETNAGALVPQAIRPHSSTFATR